MPKTVFTPGSRVTAAFLNSVSNPNFLGLDTDGSREQISDAELSDVGLKLRADQFLDSLKVSLVSGVTVNVMPGTLQKADGTLIVYGGANITLPADGEHFVFFNSAGVLAANSIRPPVGLVLAKVTTSSGTIPNENSIIDLRPRYTIQSSPLATRVFGGQGGEKALVVKPTGSAGWNTELTEYTAVGSLGSPYVMRGVRYLTSMTIEANSHVSVQQGATIYVSGEVIINGTITVSTAIAGGGRFGGSVYCPSDYAASSGNGLGGASGHNPTPSSGYHFLVSNTGSGGASSYCKTRLKSGATVSNFGEFTLTTGQGGAGGGYFELEAGGSILINGTIKANGGNATTPTSGTPGTNQWFMCSGAGGGSGGSIWLKSAVAITVSGATQLEVMGGTGGTGLIGGLTVGENTFATAGGGGGGGGWVALYAPVVNTAGFDTSGSTNVKLTGGVKGATTGPGANTLSGSPGGSYAGVGGASNSNGSNGTLVISEFTPV